MNRLLDRFRTPEAGVQVDPRLIFTADHISVAYGKSVALQDVSIAAEQGDVVCVMGRNGAGKTTFLKAVMGILPLSNGRMVFGGRDITGRAPYQRARTGIGYVPQGRGIFPHLSVYENLLIGLEPSGGKDTGQLDEVYATFPVLKQMAGRVAGVLSGGQQQQLAIGRALMGRPWLLLLDEPTEGIQPNIVEEIEAVIGGLRSRMTILLVEQFLGFALANADYCYVLERGAVTIAGKPSSLSESRLREALAV